MNNQGGGFLSKIFVIPAGVALMVGFFFLGFYVGKYQGRQSVQGDKPATLPEIASQYLPKKDELTFYKTLTDREDKTVSVDLKPRQQEKTAAGAQPSEATPGRSADTAYPSRFESRAGFFASTRDECLSPRVRLECNPEIPVAPGEEHWLLDTGLDEVYWPCSHSRAIPSFPSQLEWKIGLAWANTRGSLNSSS